LFEVGSWILCEVEANNSAIREGGNNPLRPLLDAGLHLFHFPPLLELLFSGKIVAAICPHASVVLCNDTHAIASLEAADVRNSFIAVSNILAVVLISMEHNKSIEIALRHVTTELIELFVFACLLNHLFGFLKIVWLGMRWLLLIGEERVNRNKGSGRHFEQTRSFLWLVQKVLPMEHHLALAGPVQVHEPRRSCQLPFERVQNHG